MKTTRPPCARSERITKIPSRLSLNRKSLVGDIHGFQCSSSNFADALARLVQATHNEKVITLTEPQVWTLIGVFAAAIFGVLTIGFAALRSELRNSINGLRGELLGEMSSLRSEMNGRFDVVEKRIDYLDRDVQYLMRKEFGDSPNQ